MAYFPMASWGHYVIQKQRLRRYSYLPLCLSLFAFRLYTFVAAGHPYVIWVVDIDGQSRTVPTFVFIDQHDLPLYYSSQTLC